MLPLRAALFALGVLLAALFALDVLRDALDSLWPAPGAPLRVPPRYRLIDLGVLGGSESVASAINEKGQIVGHGGTGKNPETNSPFLRAFFWDGDRSRDLGTSRDTSWKKNFASIRATGINNHGQIVGTAFRASNKNGC